MARHISEWIEFGQISAERDERLSEYFFENGILEEVIRNRHHFLILGRKGAGKTAVFQHLEKTKDRYLRANDLSISFSLQTIVGIFIISWHLKGKLLLLHTFNLGNS